MSVAVAVDLVWQCVDVAFELMLVCRVVCCGGLGIVVLCLRYVHVIVVVWCVGVVWFKLLCSELACLLLFGLWCVVLVWLVLCVRCVYVVVCCVCVCTVDLGWVGAIWCCVCVLCCCFVCVCGLCCCCCVFFVLWFHLMWFVLVDVPRFVWCLFRFVVCSIRCLYVHCILCVVVVCWCVLCLCVMSVLLWFVS